MKLRAGKRFADQFGQHWKIASIRSSTGMIVAHGLFKSGKRCGQWNGRKGLLFPCEVVTELRPKADCAR